MAVPFRMYRMPAVLKLTGWSRTTLWRRVNEGKFPKPVMDTKRMAVWAEPDIVQHQLKVRAAAGLPALAGNVGLSDLIAAENAGTADIEDAA
jgi:predicted DNA-binding transcriptional regulator AlpA